MEYDVTDIARCTYYYRQGQQDLLEKQIRQRLELVRFWGIEPGWRVFGEGRRIPDRPARLPLAAHAAIDRLATGVVAATRRERREGIAAVVRLLGRMSA